MTEPTPLHLSDDALNEYLDHALAPAALAQAGAHLAACSACSARLGSLRALFASLKSLPDAALSRDLAPAVTQALRRREPALAPVVVAMPQPQRRPWLALVVGAQVVVAGLSVAVAWPYVAGLLGGAGLPASSAALVRDLLAAAQALLASADLGQLLAGWQNELRAAWTAVGQGAGLALPTTAWLAAAAGAGLVWLVSHLWLLRGPAPHTTRRP